jgi:hypothetical protein
MLLKSPFDISTQFVVQVIEHQVRYLFTGFRGQCFPPSPSFRHVDSPTLCRWVSQPHGQLATQKQTGAVKPRLYGRNCKSESAGDLSVRHAFEVA